MIGELKGSTLSIDGRLVNVGTDEYLKIALALGRRVLEEYNVGVQPWDDTKVMGLLCELFDLTSSKLCLVYDLDARCDMQLASVCILREY
jgi:hypothetical protein